MRGPTLHRRSGTTPVDACVATLALIGLAGIVYAGLAPVREGAREAHCIDNLRAISRAIGMYRADYGGGDAATALTYSQLGLPVHPVLLVPNYVRDPSVFRCPDAFFPGKDSRRLLFTYLWAIRPDDAWGRSKTLPAFSSIVAKRGKATPIVVDANHGTLFRNPEAKPYSLLVLRLSGDLRRCSRTTVNFWEW